ncbi:MAG: extracellular solute-binding protein [Clostridia bacterium]|nr:extracellular solute-binding protein [Clostridia bacterium]
MHKKLALLLCLLMLASSMAACGDSESTETTADTSADTTAVEETETETERPKAADTLTVTDFEGRDYRMISTDQDGRAVDIVAEELTGATLNDLVYNRNTAVSELYNVNMSAERNEDYSAINNTVKKDAQAGDLSYDLYLTNYTANALASGGFLYDFYQLPHVDLTREWWDQNEISDMTIYGKLYMAIGDISPTELLTSECMLFNKKLFDDNGMAYPYDAALNGEWTIDMLLEMADGLTTDLNGDGEILVQDDLFSVTCWGDYAQTLFYGMGGDMSYVADDGSVVLNIDVEQCANIYEKAYALLKGTQGNYEYSSNGTPVMEAHERSFKTFAEGRAYFCGITFQKIETFLREMEDDYGVLPNPKYDEAQQNYSTCVSGAGSMVVVPKSCTDPEFVGSMLEGMAALSYDMITPDLIDVLASTKNVRDMESSEIVQLIIRNRNFDTARMHDASPDTFTEQLLIKDSTDVASFFATNEKTYQTKVDKLNEAYSKIEG